MTMPRFKMFLLIGILISGFGLTSCTQTQPASGAHSESGHNKGSGGNAQHEHDYYND
ncbi:TPA: hypothetical protein ACK8Z3_002209 [Legionella pneumophila]|uniref:hypothetical protein n=2 Tax=Legionella pneumophila TaxID=446 RepID=UPI0002C084F3|nr:hypothetical protein [Legionella pneumophila]ERH41789.1 hypothetical protein N750_16070 [Legionella pneumophila str. Leg01/53]ERH44289.1 hypothetical protein N751_14265 [Legionella pneumophila str. Leg01/11]ERI46977.1 hypothetical protein N749_16135 [Legionella pneumophila str. Leg01/20]WBV62310.1 hypothetical protein PGH43_10195 [Legionella pneumophila 130b]AGH54273.1 hypothetical protein LPE509_02182 [Legionella pneumophila subsp. pneumophila LPE509]